MSEPNIDAKMQAEKFVSDIAGETAKQEAEKLEKSFDSKLEKIVEIQTKSIEAMNTLKEVVEKQQEKRKSISHTSFGDVDVSSQNSFEDKSDVIKENISNAIKKEGDFIHSKSDEMTLKSFINIVQKDEKIKTKSYNTFNDRSGGLSMPYPVFGGIVDDSTVSVNNLMQYCNIVSMGNLVAGSYQLDKMNINPVVFSSYKKTPELTVYNKSEELKFDRTYIPLKKYTTYTEISVEAFETNMLNQGLYNVLDMHNKALDTAQMATMDSVFFHGTDMNAGLNTYIEKGLIKKAKTGSTSAVSLEAIKKAYNRIPAALRNNGVVDVILPVNIADEINFDLTSGSGEFINAPYYQAGGYWQVGNAKIRIISLELQALSNPENKDEFKGFSETLSNGEIVGIVGNLQALATYLTSSNFSMGFSSKFEKNTLETGKVFMSKTLTAGFGIVNSNAAIALEVGNYS